MLSFGAPKLGGWWWGDTDDGHNDEYDGIDEDAGVDDDENDEDDKNDEEDYDVYCCLLKRRDHRPFSFHTGTFILNFQLEYKTRRKQKEQILNFQLEH